MAISLMEYALADIKAARSALLAVAEKDGNIKATKGIAAYHTQQAMEKIIKHLIYLADPDINPKKIYTHKIHDLCSLASQYGTIHIPELIKKNAVMYTDWEAAGRYDLHFVVRIDSIENALDVVEEWHEKEFRLVFYNNTEQMYERIAVEIPDNILKKLRISYAPEATADENFHMNGFQNYANNKIIPSNLGIKMDLLNRNKADIVQNIDKIIDEKNVSSICSAIEKTITVKRNLRQIYFK